MENSSHDDEEIKNEEFEIDVSQLPSSKEGWFKSGLTLYQGCWYISSTIPNIISFQKKFQPQDQDIVFSSTPKSGTTWMKALLFSVLNRDRYDPSNTPLLVSNPHDLVPSFEYTLFSDPPKHNIADIPSPRLFSTHVSYASLPDPVLSKSRVVYICRNPLDTIVSFWHFVSRYDSGTGPHWSLDDCVDAFCRGESGCGPFWVHVLGFWKASLENPEKVLFLKYEDLLEDPVSHVKYVAEFVGFPFSEEDESLGVVEKIVELCSIGNLKSLDVNKNGKLAINGDVGGDIFFRKGKVGDWVNHLSPSMVEKVKEVIEEKLSGSGLIFKYNL